MGFWVGYQLLVSGAPDDLERFRTDPRCIRPMEVTDGKVFDDWATKVAAHEFGSEGPWPEDLAVSRWDEPCHQHFQWSWRRGARFVDWLEAFVVSNPELTIAYDEDWSDLMDQEPADWCVIGVNGRTEWLGWRSGVDAVASLKDYPDPLDWLRGQCARASEHAPARFCSRCDQFAPVSAPDPSGADSLAGQRRCAHARVDAATPGL
jgi:hypothetical protein